LYGACALAVFFVLVVIASLAALVVPRLEWRRALTHRLARIALAILGLRVTATGLENLPEGSCVVVANHSSYVDGVVLTAILPPRFSFVIKREAADMPFVGLLLRRIGSEFVDRSDQGGRQRGARRVIKRAEQGHALVFFPEGTFDQKVGLKRFHAGAFIAAVRGGVPVVPTIIHGARRAMPGNALLVRPGRIQVEFLAPLPADGEKPDALREVARRLILERLDEPDLAPHVATRPNAAHVSADDVAFGAR
jgi:1-acyl-sn-glycerol-3-phosphate acyltransferase